MAKPRDFESTRLMRAANALLKERVYTADELAAERCRMIFSALDAARCLADMAAFPIRRSA